ncbi:hypothetical protein COOONC_15814 [Cooperia oncophora]
MQWLLGLSALICYVHCQLNCDILDPECRALYRAGGKRSTLRHKARPGCNEGPQCLRDAIPLVQIRIKPDVVRLPGCFTLEIKNLRVKDDSDAIGNSFFAKAEYQWWNVKDFSNLRCQNASNNGCGGYGNNW